MYTLFPSRPKPLSALIALAAFSSTSAWADAHCDIADLAANNTPIQAIMDAERGVIPAGMTPRLFDITISTKKPL
ncbi:hypothetical protein [Salinivibrio kushneri]|uniref:hypothetical protein n=1 Tax=Salinivibrio kushneri TaxID=1908198 RepID=UPI0009899ABF|nr:hypothetical protein [Salinivibrio kushneri]